MIRSLLAALIALSVFVAGPAVSAEVEHLNIKTEFAPPHNEPVIGDRVARYRVEATATLTHGRLSWTPKLTAWGVNPWRNSDAVGHFPGSWENSDWSVEQWRVSTTQVLEVRIFDSLALTTEYYLPIDRKRWGGHGLERHYYWLTGFKFGW